MPRILRLSLRNLVSSKVSSPSKLPAWGSTLKAMGPGKTDAGGNSSAAPSNVKAAALSATARICSSSSAVPANPEPDTA